MWVTHFLGMGFDFNLIVPLLLSCCGFPCVLGYKVSFSVVFQCPPVNSYSIASCDFGVLAREDECMSFYSTVLGFPITHQQTIVLNIYWAWPCPPKQDPVFPKASPSHQEACTSLLSSSIRGQTIFFFGLVLRHIPGLDVCFLSQVREVFSYFMFKHVLCPFLFLLLLVTL